MTLLVFFVGLMTAMILDRQAKRQSEGMAKACERFGVTMAETKPRLPRLEAWLNIYLGLTMTFVCGLYLLVSIIFIQESHSADVGEFSAAVMGTGIAMVVLGIRGMKELHAFRARRMSDAAPRSA